MPRDQLIRYRAEWIVPISSPPIHHGYIDVEDARIVEVGCSLNGNLTPPTKDSPKHSYYLPGIALLPGFINAHTHLDLTFCARKGESWTDSFASWLSHVIGQRSQADAAVVADSIEAGIGLLIRSGTTSVGDISANGSSYARLRHHRFSGIVFREVLGRKPERYEALFKPIPAWMAEEESHFAAADFVSGDANHGAMRPSDPPLMRSISPHAPYSTDPCIYAGAANSLRSRGTQTMPMATHWLETVEEIRALNDQEGPIQDMLTAINAFSPDSATPFYDAPNSTYLDPSASWILIHGNYLREVDLVHFRASGNLRGIVYCPRTHAYFGHPLHPVHWLDFEPFPIALGTDSLASSPSLSVFDEARFLAKTSSLTPNSILEMLTIQGARVLGIESDCGAIRSGKWANLAALDVGIDSGRLGLEKQLLSAETEVVGTMIAGEWAFAAPTLTHRLSVPSYGKPS